jgi:hypothetical protein
MSCTIKSCRVSLEAGKWGFDHVRASWFTHIALMGMMVTQVDGTCSDGTPPTILKDLFLDAIK